MNIFSLQPYEIIRHWKNFRNELEKKSKDQILKEINAFWWKAPYYHYVIDYEKPDTWPSPWELIFENQYDDAARAYMMAETIFMINVDFFKDSEINLMVIRNHFPKEITTILVVDNLVLNYYHDDLEDLNKILKKSDIMLIYERDEKSWKEKKNVKFDRSL